MSYTKAVCKVAGLFLLVAQAACSGDSFEPGETIVKGSIFLPPPGNCVDQSDPDAGCTASNVQVVTFQPRGQNAPTIPNNDGSGTSESGVFSTGDLTTFLSDHVGSGPQTIISVAVVANSTGSTDPAIQTRIGGLVPHLTPGAVATKDFNPTTHIACAAGVFLTGQNVSQPPSPPCANQIRQLGFIDPNDIDQQRTDILEQASSTIADDVLFPTQVNCAACAVIVCTRGGLCSSTDECVDSTFRTCTSAPAEFDLPPVSCAEAS